MRRLLPTLILLASVSFLHPCQVKAASFLPESLAVHRHRQPRLLSAIGLRGGGVSSNDRHPSKSKGIPPVHPPTASFQSIAIATLSFVSFIFVAVGLAWTSKHNKTMASTQQRVRFDTPEELSEDLIANLDAVLVLGGGPSHGWLRTNFPRLPDYLTYLRCAAIPLICFAFQSPEWHVQTGSLFALASLTDWFDGFLARRWNVSTTFGAFLDPVADKLMVGTALILLSSRHGTIVALPACIILARELAVSALREWMAQRGQRDAVKVGFQGKVKAALTMVSLTLMLSVPEIRGKTTWMANLFLPSLALLYVSSIITVTSGLVYFRAAAPVLFDTNEYALEYNI